MFKIQNLLFLDIETCGKYKDFDEFKMEDPDGALIFDHKCERMGYGSPEFGYQDKVSLFPEFGKIVCLSYGIWDNGNIIVKSIADENESDLMKKAANLFNKAGAKGLVPCGWNIKNFDIPWCIRKMLMHGIPVSSSIETYGKKPWEVSITDLKEWWKSFSNLDVTFEEAAYSLGLPSPKDEMDGSKVHHEYYYNRNHDVIVKYCEKDVRTMILMIEKISKIYGNI